MHVYKLRAFALAFAIILPAIIIAHTALSDEAMCTATDTTCVLQTLQTTTAAIENKNWRDKTYRELAKLLTRKSNTDGAIAIIGKIENPDTKALTIRGIGMEASKTGLSKPQIDALFIALRQEAEKIQHPPSYAIALTYIAMAQAFAGDDDGAMKTAKDMENDALRNKAFAESAEIQAERGELGLALESIKQIDSAAFRNKAYVLISKIFSKQGKYNEALKAADQIDNAYQKSQAILFLAAQQISPEEVSLVE